MCSILLTKTCTKCKQNKPSNKFNTNNRNRSKLHSICKDCSRKYNHNRYKQNKSKILKLCKKYCLDNKDKISLRTKSRALKRNFNITQEEYDEMLKQQDNTCAICNTDKCSTGRSFAVDHSHTTGKIRGLLCFNCNAGLGHYMDDPGLLIIAAEYILEGGQVG